MDYSSPSTVKNHNELLRCFSALCKYYFSQIIKLDNFYCCNDFDNTIILRKICYFGFAAKSFADKLIAFLLVKLEVTNDRTRIGTLSIFRHLVNSSGKTRYMIAHHRVTWSQSNFLEWKNVHFFSKLNWNDSHLPPKIVLNISNFQILEIKVAKFK